MMRRPSLSAHLLAAAVVTSIVVPAHAQKQAAQPDLYRAQPQGGLSGATIYLNPGHGWMFSKESGKWITQRGVTNNLIEDHSNAEAVLQYLVPYLWNAGAKVETTRERDLQSNMVIVEAGGPDHTQSGSWNMISDPGAWNGDARIAQTVPPETETAKVSGSVFTPKIPEAGYYAVYAWYAPVQKHKMAPDAQYVIRHTGGTTIWTQDQNVDARSWRYMGTYYFDKGSNGPKGSVTLLNTSGDKKSVVAADAIRFGGGIGESGHPRWEESGLYYAQFMGYDIQSDTRNVNTVSAMPMFAEWDVEADEKGRSIYAAWHTNASGTGNSRGLFSFVYGPDEWGGLDKFTGYPGGVELVTTVHNEIINDVHAAYDPQWRNGAIVTRWLGETNPRNNNRMPAALWEMGFHDNPQDAEYILDPRFRQIVARAVYQGIVKYYRENVPGYENAKLLPEPPTHFCAKVNNRGAVELSWHHSPYNQGEGLLGDAATAYRVYRSTNGKGFDNGFEVDGNAAVISRMTAGETTYFRITAVNEGGESFPTETLAVRVNPGKPEILLVNGFDRLDRGLNIWEGSERGILAKMNTRDYVIQHAESISAADYAISSTSNEALSSGTIRMSDHAAVVWILGQETGETDALSAREQELLRGYLPQGGGLLISGSDAAADIAKTPKGEELLREWFRVKVVSNETTSREISAPPGVAGSAPSLFDGIPSFTFGDSNGTTYPVKSPDVTGPTGGSEVALVYSDGTPAAVQYEARHRVLYFGFPFETINERQARDEVMKRALQFIAKAQETQ